MDAASWGYLDGLRRQHFPADRNFIPAHLTLFHHLPGGQLQAIQAELAGNAGQQARLPLEVDGLRFLGRGVAFTVRSTELNRLRGRLAAAWQPWLGAQDRQAFRPHVTVQNKAAPAAARELHAALAAGFAPFTVEGCGLLLWRYLGGPWEAVVDVPFTG